MRQSVRRPIILKTLLAPGTIDQPTSWPWVEATTLRAPAARAAPPISASGVDDPNQTVSIPRSLIRADIARAVAGVGNITDRGQRTIS